MKDKTRTITVGEVTMTVKRPGKKELNDSQLVYNRSWRNALENGAMLRAKLDEFLEEQGVWSKTKQKQYEVLLDKIRNAQKAIKKGGVKLKVGRARALELVSLRREFRDLISEKTNYDTHTAEGIADNERFDYLVSVCVFDQNDKPMFSSVDDYNEKASEDWAAKAASELASMLYDIDPNYDDSLPENEFLKKFNMVDDKGRLVNKEGHLIAIGDNDEEILIDEEGFRVAYGENGVYRVDSDGEKLDEESLPFLDDDGNPLT